MNAEYSIIIGFVIVTLLVISILVIKGVIIYFHPSSVFVPTHLTYEEIQHNHLSGWFLKGELDKVILFCHGNAGNISHREYKLANLHNLGYSVMIFDYSGFGKSSGVPSEQQCYDDASSMIELLLNSYDKSQIVTYGESLGASVAAYVARRHSLPMVILESPFPSIKSFMQSVYPLLSWFSLLCTEFNTESYIIGYPGKSLVVHSIHDEMIPYTSSRVLRENATAVLTVKGTHNKPDINWDSIQAFIR